MHQVVFSENNVKVNKNERPTVCVGLSFVQFCSLLLMLQHINAKQRLFQAVIIPATLMLFNVALRLLMTLKKQHACQVRCSVRLGSGLYRNMCPCQHSAMDV